MRIRVYIFTLLSIVIGSGMFFHYLFFLRSHSCFSEDASSCMNCHIMAPYYATEAHSSHARVASCNDCHVPHENVVRKYWFKATDGARHVMAFLMTEREQTIVATDRSAEVVMNNCIRCHQDLNQTLVSTGNLDFMATKVGEGKACWDCHREVPHGRNSLSTAQNTIAPYPSSPVPSWLKESIKKLEKQK